MQKKYVLKTAKSMAFSPVMTGLKSSNNTLLICVIALFSIFGASNVFGQVANYTFSESAGTIQLLPEQLYMLQDGMMPFRQIQFRLDLHSISMEQIIQHVLLIQMATLLLGLLLQQITYTHLYLIIQGMLV